MKTTGSIFDYIQIGVIASGGDPKGEGKSKGDHPTDKSSNQKVILPMIHDPKGVKQEHLSFSPMIHSPTAFSQMSFQGALDPGALVYFLKMPGEAGGMILGQANDLVNYDKGASGGNGQDLLGHQFFQELFNRETGINIPPDIQETEEDGVKVKAIKEKNKKHKHALLKGLPSHNAIQSTTGYKLEQIKEIPTARQHFDAMPTTDLLSQMPGDLASLGGMFQGLLGGIGGGGGGGGGGNSGNGNIAQGAGQGSNPGQTTIDNETPMDRIRASIDPSIFDAMLSLATLTQGSGADTSAFVTAGRVHTPTYLANAEQLLSQVDSLEELFVAIHRLQYDTSLFGLENLSNTIISLDTAWGNANVTLTFAGVIDLLYANSNTEVTFVENMVNPTTSPGSLGGGSGSGGAANMFGKSAETMQDMFKRLPKNNQKEAKTMHETLNQQDDAQKLWKFVEKTIKGGNPLDPSHFEG